MDLKKKIYGILLFVAVITILLLTFQDSEGTVRLSESLRHLFEQIGIHSDFHSIRSNIHIVLYFVFGVVLSLFGRKCGWNWWVILIIGCGFGLLDEGIKVLLPTREFDIIDAAKDWIGVATAMIVIHLIEKNGR